MWVKVDDKLHGHRKTVRAGDDAMGLWVIAMSWCADYETDGFIPAYWVESRKGGMERAAQLVKAGFWHEAERDGEPGFQVHGWTDYQPTRSELETQRRAAAERKARSRATKAAT